MPDSVTAMCPRRPLERSHLFGETPPTLTQTNLGQLANRCAPGTAVSVRLCVDLCK